MLEISAMAMYGVSIGMDYPHGPWKEVFCGSVNSTVHIQSALISFLNFKRENVWLLIDNPPSGDYLNGHKANLVNRAVIL
jgi:hypothetical protein